MGTLENWESVPIAECKAALRRYGVTSSVAGKGRPDRDGEPEGAGLRLVAADTARAALKALDNGAKADTDGKLKLGVILAHQAPIEVRPLEPTGGPGRKTGGDLAATIAEAIKGHVQASWVPIDVDAVRKIAEDVALDVVSAAGIDDEAIRAAVLAELDKRPPVRISIGDGPTKDLPAIRHEKFERVLELACGLTEHKNVYLVGPAGTGKTTLAEQIAEVLGLRFAFISCSAGTGEAALLGRLLPIEAGGTWGYVPADFVEVYEFGGVFLIDEVDASDSNLLVVINSALANGHLSVPSRREAPVIKRHPDCIIIAAANTYGTGADATYVARECLDGAFMDRFADSKVEIDYSPAIEGSIAEAYGASGKKALEWTWKLRAAIRKAKLRRIASTRALVGHARHGTAAKLPAFKESFFAGWSASERAAVNAPKEPAPIDWAKLAEGI